MSYNFGYSETRLDASLRMETDGLGQPPQHKPGLG